MTGGAYKTCVGGRSITARGCCGGVDTWDFFLVVSETNTAVNNIEITILCVI
jgi:hypothetical protein